MKDCLLVYATLVAHMSNSALIDYSMIVCFAKDKIYSAQESLPDHAATLGINSSDGNFVGGNSGNENYYAQKSQQVARINRRMEGESIIKARRRVAELFGNCNNTMKALLAMVDDVLGKV